MAAFILLSILPGDGAAVMADYGAEASMEVAIMAAVIMAAAGAAVTDLTASTDQHTTEIAEVEILIIQEEETAMAEEAIIMALA